MRVAIVHDWLNTRVGGSEKVLMELANLYPDADIYTLIFRPEFYRGQIDPKRVTTSHLQRWPRLLTDKPSYLLPLLPTAIEQFDLSSYDVVISSSNAFSKGVLTPPRTLHICYCYSPMRFAWDYWPRYLTELSIGPIRRMAARGVISKVRLWDYYSSKRVDHWIAISDHIAARIKKYYGAKAEVIYPPVQIDDFEPLASRSDHYLTLSTLTPYKKIDLAIKACNQLGRKLIVVGSGFDRKRLEGLAGPTIKFAGRVSDEEKARLLATAKALLNPQEEDFGIASVEALASGIPVIAFARGGAAEIVSDGETGVLYEDDSVEGLVAAIKRSEALNYDRDQLLQASRRFSASYFAKTFTTTVEKLYADHISQL